MAYDPDTLEHDEYVKGSDHDEDEAETSVVPTSDDDA